MCTLTYLPIKNNGFLLTSSRDEKPERQVSDPPRKHAFPDFQVVYPIDKTSQGTWIASANNCFSVALVNGAFEKHTPKNSYRQSRGTIIPEFYKFSDIDSFYNKFEFEDIEPFRLIIICLAGETHLLEIIWDGNRKHRFEHNATIPHIWSSAMLYDEKTIKEREEYFKEWAEQHEKYDLMNALLFHKTKDEKSSAKNILKTPDENNIQTISITSIYRTALYNKLRFEDLLNQKIYMVSPH